MSEETKLAACPFCGGEGELLRDGAPYIRPVAVGVWCKQCHVQNTFDRKTESFIVKYWNTRAGEK